MTGSVAERRAQHRTVGRTPQDHRRMHQGGAADGIGQRAGNVGRRAALRPGIRVESQETEENQQGYLLFHDSRVKMALIR